MTRGASLIKAIKSISLDETVTIYVNVIVLYSRVDFKQVESIKTIYRLLFSCCSVLVIMKTAIYELLKHSFIVRLHNLPVISDIL